MDHMREEIRIEAPVEHVWEFYCDTSRWHDWMPRMEVSQVSGPIDQPGTTYLSVGKVLGFEFKQTFTIVEVKPLELIHEHSSDQGSQDNYLRFERDGDGTHVILESDYEMPGHIPAFIKSAMTKTFFERNVRSALEDFKLLAEATVAVPA